MEFQMYDCHINETPTIDNKHWAPTMDNNEYFNWNGIKIDEQEPDGKRKRRLQQDHQAENEANLIGQAKNARRDDKCNDNAQNDNGTPRMPQWQVDDITDLNADIEGSFTGGGGGGDHSNNSFNMSEAILSLSGMAVLKQEAPSPPNDYARQQPHSPSRTTGLNHQGENSNGGVEQGTNAMLNATIQQLLSQSGYNQLPNTIDGNLLNASSQDYCFGEDCRFQYVLAAATSIATKINEDTLTYLNQGQSYEIKLKKLGDLSTYKGKLLKSVIKICFHERRLQYMEKEQISSWQQSRPGDRILEIDVPLSYGLYDVMQPTGALNTVQFSWDPTKEVGAYIKVNCISTEFTPKKHGGEKGVPFRIQVETYQTVDGCETPKRLHAAACQIKVFKLKGADRKHKQDREKILKRSLTEQEKYQPSYDCTVLNDIPNDSLVPTPPISAPYSPESNSQTAFQNGAVPAIDDKNLVSLTPASSPGGVDKQPPQDVEMPTQYDSNIIVPGTNPQQMHHWLNANRFEKFAQTFANFSGADMLRMTRDDFIQICGHADGIRLFNALHSKSIAPRLTLYLCKENSVYNALYLNRLTICELVQKLAGFLNVSADHVKDVYVLGPKMIHVQLNADMIKHIDDETMFNVEILHSHSHGDLNECGKFVVLLKPANKN